MHAVDAGDLVVICIATFFNSGTGGTWVVTDDAGQTYTEAVDSAGDASSQIAIFYKENHPGGSIKVTVNPDGASGDIDFTITEVSGAATSSALDKTAEATGGTNNTATVSLATLSQAAEIKFAIFSHTGGDTSLTAGSGFTQIGENESNSGGQTYHAEYEIVSATTDVVCNGTFGGPRDWFICAASFIEAAAGGDPIRLRFPPQFDGMGVGGMLGGSRVH